LRAPLQLPSQGTTMLPYFYPFVSRNKQGNAPAPQSHPAATARSIIIFFKSKPAIEVSYDLPLHYRIFQSAFFEHPRASAV